MEELGRFETEGKLILHFQLDQILFALNLKTKNFGSFWSEIFAL